MPTVLFENPLKTRNARRMRPHWGLVVILAAAFLCTHAHAHVTPCVDGKAGDYTCSDIDLAALVTLKQLGGNAEANASDIWGWTDKGTGKEYALIGLSNGTAFVDITLPDHPEVLGLLPTHSVNSLWRGIKVYADHAYIVSEASDHGMQVFDLKRLRNVANPPQTFTADAHYDMFSTAHNIVINEDSGFAYAVGSRAGKETCDAGLHMIDLKVPLSPKFAGCFSEDRYTHDAQCVIYEGPDTQHKGREICVNANEDTLTIVDVTNKAAPVQLARETYTGRGYTHQGWFTEDQRWFLMNDELDEIENGHNTRTYAWDMSDLDRPKQTFVYTAQSTATDHNLYIRDHFAYLTNYAAGLRILDLSGIAQSQLKEIAYFDTQPDHDKSGFDGTWTSYPFFPSGTIIVSDMWDGLYVLQADLCEQPAAATGLKASAAGDNKIGLSWNATADASATYEVYRELGGCGADVGERLAGGLSTPNYSDILASGDVDYGYRVRVAAAASQCSSAFSECVETRTTGTCTAPPMFGGLASATSAGTSQCAVKLAWEAAQPSCSGPVSYDVYRSPTPNFEPSEALRIGNTTSTALSDASAESGKTYHYLVRARDGVNGATEENQTTIMAKALGPIGTGTWTNGAEPGEPIFGNSAKHVAWHVVDDTAHGGTRSYHSGYDPMACVQLYSAPIDLGTGGNSELSFWHRFGTSVGNDGGIVEISSDKETWQRLTPSGGYPQKIKPGSGCDFPDGTGVFSGTQNDWQKTEFKLEGMKGVVHVRWIFSAGTALDQKGWWIDDVQVSPAQVESACTTTPTEAEFQVGPGISGLWYNGNRGGEGFVVGVLDEKSAWVTWFTYDNEGKQLWLQGLGAIDGDTILVKDLNRSKASGFGPNFDSSSVEFTRWGQLELRFGSCGSGTFSWDATGFGKGSYPMNLLAPLSEFPCDDDDQGNTARATVRH